MMNKRLKSVHLTNYYHENSGGIGTAYNHLLEAGNRQKRYVRLIVPGEIAKVKNVGEFGKIYFVKASVFPFFDNRYRVLLPDKYIFDDSPIRKILIDEMPDIIEICDKYSISLLAGMIRKGYLKELNRPMLVHLSCERMDDNIASYISSRKIANRFARRFMSNFNFPMFDFYTANSNYTAGEIFDSIYANRNLNRSEKFYEFCLKFFNAAKLPIEERIFINHCGVDTEVFTHKRKADFKRKSILEKLKIPDSAKILLYAGRLSPEKNVQILPEIMSLLENDKTRDFRLIIAGSGPKKDRLESELKKFASNKYNFVGHLADKEKLADLYANVDVFIHPNPREPFGIGLLEAMSSGTPVIAPNSGGVLSYANNGNAWLVEPHADEFAEQIQKIFNFPDEREIKIKNALETVKNFTWKKATDNIFSQYDEMFAKFKSRHKEFVYSKNNRDTENISSIISEIKYS
jgi:glycosyltransferase involved in cell wall biosynthesis